MNGLPGVHVLVLVPTVPSRERGSAMDHPTEALNAMAAGKRL